MSEHCSIEQVKIYGERNTGTRFVKALVRLNFLTSILEGGVNAEERAKRRVLTRGLGDSQTAMLVEDRFETEVHPRLVVAEGRDAVIRSYRPHHVESVALDPRARREERGALRRRPVLHRDHRSGVLTRWPMGGVWG